MRMLHTLEKSREHRQGRNERGQSDSFAVATPEGSGGFRSTWDVDPARSWGAVQDEGGLRPHRPESQKMCVL